MSTRTTGSADSGSVFMSVIPMRWLLGGYQDSDPPLAARSPACHPFAFVRCENEYTPPVQPNRKRHSPLRRNLLDAPFPSGYYRMLRSVLVVRPPHPAWNFTEGPQAAFVSLSPRYVRSLLTAGRSSERTGPDSSSRDRCCGGPGGSQLRLSLPSSPWAASLS